MRGRFFHVPRRVMNRKLLPVLGGTACFLLGSTLLAQEKLPTLENPGEFQAFAKANCLSCHNAKEAEGGFDLEDLLKGKNVSASPAAWHAALERIVSRDMPPKKAKVSHRRGREVTPNRRPETADQGLVSEEVQGPQGVQRRRPVRPDGQGQVPRPRKIFVANLSGH